MENNLITLCAVENAPAIQQNGVATLETFALDAGKILARKAMLQQVMERIMQEGTHYGKIPGCGNNPSLLKPGAEAIASTFQLCPRYQITKTELGNGHREYELICELYNPAGGFIGQGVGSATTMEGKYRFRVGGGEATDLPVPKAFWDKRKTDPRGASMLLADIANKAGVDGESFGTQKVDGQWFITTKAKDEKVEHDNPADYYNTVLKMGKKRAFVDAVLTATGASDIFTQDIEDMPEVIPGAAKRQTQSPQQTHSRATSQGNVMDGMDDMPGGYGEPAPMAAAKNKAATEQQRKAVFGSCKSKGIDLDTLCLSLTDANSFGRAINRVNDLDGAEISKLIGWLNEGELNHLAPATA